MFHLWIHSIGKAWHCNIKKKKKVIKVRLTCKTTCVSTIGYFICQLGLQNWIYLCSITGMLAKPVKPNNPCCCWRQFQGTFCKKKNSQLKHWVVAVAQLAEHWPTDEIKGLMKSNCCSAVGEHVGITNLMILWNLTTILYNFVKLIVINITKKCAGLNISVSKIVR